MKIPELQNLIDELIKMEKTDSKRKSKASQLKKQYAIRMRELRVDGKEISIEDLRNLITPLIENYDSVKDLDTINEVMQTMVKDYDTAIVRNEKGKNSKSNIETEKEKIYAIILGNPGTSINGMSSEYIAKIIRRKLTEKDGINREDIMNVLNMQSKNMYMDIDNYQKLINDCIIIFLSHNSDGEQITNTKILEIMQNLASSYKVQEDYDKVDEIYKKALAIKSLENTPQYNELKSNYEEFQDYMEMKRNFDDKRFNSFKDLMKALTVKFVDNDIFVPGNNVGSDPSPSPNPQPQTSYAMPVEKKLEAIKRLVNNLKRDNKDYDILECEIGKDKYDGYVILKIENTNISIFENFHEDNARIFVIKNEVIDKVKQLSRREALTVSGVIGINHTADFDGYCKRLISAVKRSIRETQIGLAPPTEDEITFDVSLLEDSSDIQKPITQSDSASAINSNEDSEKSDETSESIEVDKVEAERRKAYKNREKLKKLEQELSELEKRTKERIASVQNQYGHGQGQAKK